MSERITALKESERRFKAELRRFKKERSYGRKLSDLNPLLLKRYGKCYAMGLLDACNVASDLSHGSTHAVGDLVLSKMNWLKKGLRVRTNRRKTHFTNPPLRELLDTFEATREKLIEKVEALVEICRNTKPTKTKKGKQ